MHIADLAAHLQEEWLVVSWTNLVVFYIDHVVILIFIN